MIQAEVAKRVGISPALVSHYMTTRYRMSWKSANRFSQTYGRTAGWWMTATPEMIGQYIDRKEKAQRGRAG